MVGGYENKAGELNGRHSLEDPKTANIMEAGNESLRRQQHKSPPISLLATGTIQSTSRLRRGGGSARLDSVQVLKVAPDPECEESRTGNEARAL